MRSKIHEYMLILIGTTMTAAAFGLFILPEGFLAGGVTGSARLICSVLDIPLFLLVLIINLCLLALGFVVMGMQFVSKSVFSSLYFPFALEILEHICLTLDRLPVPVVSAIAGAVLGIGAALVIKGKGSSGGYDIIAIILNSKFNLPIPIIVNGIDLTLILTQIPGSSPLTLFGGFFAILVSTAMMHLTLKIKSLPYTMSEEFRQRYQTEHERFWFQWSGTIKKICSLMSKLHILVGTR